jgi:hypothetical protein
MPGCGNGINQTMTEERSAPVFPIAAQMHSSERPMGVELR